MASNDPKAPVPMGWLDRLVSINFPTEPDLLACNVQIGATLDGSPPPQNNATAVLQLSSYPQFVSGLLITPHVEFAEGTFKQTIDFNFEQSAPGGLAGGGAPINNTYFLDLKILKKPDPNLTLATLTIGVTGGGSGATQTCRVSAQVLKKVKTIVSPSPGVINVTYATGGGSQNEVAGPTLLCIDASVAHTCLYNISLPLQTEIPTVSGHRI